jgi:hypothetical protein
MWTFIAAAIFAASCANDLRELSRTHYDQLSQRRFDEFEKQARSGALHVTVDLAIEQERFHLNSLRNMDAANLETSNLFQRLAGLILFGIVAQVYVILRFKATRMKANVEQVHEHDA